MPHQQISREEAAQRRAALLDWYDAHARALPWRIAPADRARGVRPDPYHVWLSEIMLQQTTVATVRGYFARFLNRFATVEVLADAPLDDVLSLWSGLGYYARARNLHACAQAVAARGGFPETEEELRDLPGIGPYTAAAIAALAFDRPANVVDTNVERVMARQFAVTDPLPGSRPRLRARAGELSGGSRPGDYAQALMDLGATICMPRRPRCDICPWNSPCRGLAAGIAETLPKKAPKRPRRPLFARAYVVEHERKVLLYQRPAEGLLGGLWTPPESDWLAELPTGHDGAPLKAHYAAKGRVRHVFTHIELTVDVASARIEAPPAPRHGQRWMDIDALGEAPLSTLARKILARAGIEAGRG